MMFFLEANFVVTDPLAHDKAMGFVLSLPYLMNMAFSKTLTDHDLELLEMIAGTTSTLQYMLAQSVVKEETELVWGLLKENHAMKDIFKTFRSAFNEITDVIQFSEFEQIHEGLKSALGSQESYEGAHERRQRAYEAIKDSIQI